jgi:hypothetical protein
MAQTCTMASAPPHVTSLPQDELACYLAAGQSEVSAVILWQAQVSLINSITEYLPLLIVSTVC